MPAEEKPPARIFLRRMTGGPEWGRKRMSRIGYKTEENQKQEKQPHAALFISSLRKGGSERVLVNLAEFLVKHDWQVTLVTQYVGEQEYPLPAGVKRVLSEITPAETSASRVRNLNRRLRKLRGIWKEERPDVILSFIGKNNLMALVTAAFLKIPVVVSVRGEPKEEYAGFLMRFLARNCFSRAAGVVLQTSYVLDFFPTRVKRRVTILKNPLNPAFARAPFAGEREKVIVAVGRVDQNKNHEMLIRAFSALSGDYPEYRLVIYGEGDQRQRLLELAGRLPGGERISLPGAVDDVAERIYRASIFALTSYSEGVPNTLLEAMCMGIPAIATNCPSGGPRELIRDGRNGLLIPVGEEEALEMALRRLLSDAELREKMGREAAKLLREYDPEKVCGRWMFYLDTKRRGL